MPKKGFSLDFEGFNELVGKLNELDDNLLQVAVDNAFTKSKDFVNNEVGKAFDNSKYNFDGNKYSQGKAKKSLEKVKSMPVEWTGTKAKAYIGVDLHDALEVAFIMYGTPHMAADKKIYNAIKVKGNIKKQVEQIQKEEFNKVIEEALR